VSGGIDEHSLARFVAAGAPIDAAGVGTSLAVAADAPSLDTAYKLVSYAGRPVRKMSPGKATMPGAKQAWRPRAGGEDVITHRDEVVAGAEPLLVPVVRAGRRIVGRATIAEARARFEADRAALPDAARRLDDPQPLPALFSPALHDLARQATPVTQAG
jgi:nicotinate phosphoribosyltransferase